MPASTPRRRARRGEGGRLRAEILDATDLLLRERGAPSAISIDDITRTVGCTPPALYRHFADKHALLREVSERHYATFAEALNVAGSAGASPLDALAKRGRAYIDFGLANPTAYRILFMASEFDPVDAADAAIRVRANSAFDDQVRAVQACIDAGQFAPGEAHTIACALWAGTHGITSLRIAKPGFDWPDLDALFSATSIAQGVGLALSAPPGACAPETAVD